MSNRSVRSDTFLSWLYCLKQFAPLVRPTLSRVISFQSRPVKPVDKLEKEPRENEIFLYNPAALVEFYSKY